MSRSHSYYNLANREFLQRGKVLINTSVSKQMYSFPKAIRFAPPQKSSSSFFYNLPSLIGKRGTSIGYGQKMDPSKKDSSGPDQIYSIPREFESKNGSPKYSFGLGRSMVKINNSRNAALEKNTPSPATYNPYKDFGWDASKFSIFSRRSLVSEKTNFPGPGAYKHVTFDKDGKYSLSSMPSAPQNGFGLSKSRRFIYNYEKTPGPGAYQSTTNINGSGVVFNSRYQSMLGKSLSGRNIISRSTQDTPGPGSYDVFSDFEGFQRMNKNLIRLRK